MNMQTLNRAFNPYKEDQLAKETRADELRFRKVRQDEGTAGEWKPAARSWVCGQGEGYRSLLLRYGRPLRLTISNAGINPLAANLEIDPRDEDV